MCEDACLVDIWWAFFITYPPLLFLGFFEILCSELFRGTISWLEKIHNKAELTGTLQCR